MANSSRDSVVASAGAGAVAGGAAAGNSRKACGAMSGNQPTASRLNARCTGMGDGGSLCVSGFVRIVTPHQAISSTTIAVVTYMIFSASSEDSWMPFVLRHQTYTVMARAMPAATRFVVSFDGDQGWPK